ncbi:MAG: hypothetical protein K2V38_00750 [Gemmataceae bacterium]|nr:hypothetical protein [Gemmataceae bacterium]
MSRSHKALACLLVALFGVWGCTQGPPAATAPGKSKSEADYRSTLEAREQLRYKLIVAEEDAAQARKELEELRAASAAERESLKAEVKARTAERDALQGQYEAFRKSLREMIGSADAAAVKLGQPAPGQVSSTAAVAER